VSPRILVALATYNEIENLPSLVAEIRAQLPTAELLIVDDNSPDGTGQWAAAQAHTQDWLHCRHRPQKLGLGSATWLAMHAAIDDGYDLLITMDADWSHPPAALGPLVEATTQCDVVVGSRYCPGGAIDGWPWHRRVVSRVMNWATGVALGLPVRDASTAYRAYRTSSLASIDFSQLQATGYAYLEEILVHLHRQGVRMCEVPIVFSERRAGRSKIHVGEAVGKFRVLARLAGRGSRRTG
jgi:dolichol-phosphate mannosyltransferase